MHRLVSLLAIALLAFATDAAGAGMRYGRGDAEAVFNAPGTGGDVLVVHAGRVEGTPAQQGLRVRPFQSFGGTHICAADWHVANTVLHVVGDATYSHAQAVADLAPLVAHFSLDGLPLETSVTPVKSWPVAEELVGFEVGYWASYGTILAPDALAPGTHTIRLVIDNFNGPGLGEDFGDVTFYVDAVGTGACV